jgi:N,N'-diacetyllegionaminate synthase
MKSPVKIVAEIAQAHEGSLGILHSYIDAAADAGADYIKFQTHIAEAESSIHEPFRVKFSYQDATRFDYWKRMEFTAEQWVGIKKHCDDKKIKFLSSPFSIAAVELISSLGVDLYKIGSGEISNFLMLEKIGKIGGNVLLSSGMSGFDEIERAVEFFSRYRVPEALFQCTTMYPTPARNVGLNVIPQMIEQFDIPIGFSDHSGSIFPSLGAVALGCEWVEVHIVFDKKMFGPDASSSLTISEFSQLVKGIRFLEESISNPVDKNNTTAFESVKTIFNKSLAVRRDLVAGTKISFDDLESKKPAGMGIPANMFESIIGKKLTKHLNKYDFLTKEDLE